VGGWTLLEEHRGDLGQGGVKKQRGRIGGVSKVGGWILLEEHRGDLGHRVGEGGVRVGKGGWVCPPPRHTLSRRLPSATHAVRSIARGAWAPARRVDAPLRCGVPQGPHHLVRWCGGVVRRGVSVGAEQARARTPFASPAGDSAIRRPRRSGCARPAPCAHALRASACATAEGAGGASARSQRAHIAHLWDVDGEEAAGSHAWAATRSACSRRARSGAACWQRGGE